MKFTSAAAIAALTLASSQSLAAPMPRDAPEHNASDNASVTETDAGADAAGLKKKRSDASLAEAAQPELRKKSSMIRDEEGNQPRRVSGSDQIRRGIPLTNWATDTTHLRQRRGAPAPNELDAAKQPPSDGLVGTLGLDGALASLGLGGLVGTLEGAVGGLPVVGGLVAPLLGTVDNTVGVTALLSPKGSGAAVGPGEGPPAPTREKRQLGGGIPLSTLLGALGQIQNTAGGVVGTATGTLGAVTAGTPLGGVAGTVGGVAGSTMNTGSTSLLGGLSIAQAEALGLLPAGFANSLFAQIAQTPVDQATASKLIAQAHQANAAMAAAAPAPAAAKAAAAPASGVLNYLIANGAGGAPAASASGIASSAVASGAAAAPTFSIAPAAAVQSAMAGVNQAKAAKPAKSATSTQATDGDSSASEYSDSDAEGATSDDDGDEDEEAAAMTGTMAATATSASSTSATATTAAAAHGQTLIVEAPTNAKRTYNAVSSRSMAGSPSQHKATNEAMRIQQSDMGETAVPANSGEKADMARVRSLD